MVVTGTIIEGYGVASGQGTNSPYPQGTILMQLPFFEKRGLDIRCYYPGTLNVSIAPHTFKIVRADYTFPQVGWTDVVPPETFSFVHCGLIKETIEYASLVYYPHPETKPAHFQQPSTVELLAPYIPNLSYGSEIELRFDDDTIQVT